MSELFPSDEYAVPKPDIKRRCVICSSARAPRWPDGCRGVVSPTGVEHIGYDGGETWCGKDATGDDWWWPL